jgi:putative lipoprotein
MKNKVIWLVLLSGLVACNSGVSGDPTPKGDETSANLSQVTGTLMYRERMALPPDAVAEVWLLDTSIADVPAVEIAYQRIEGPGNPPIPFVLEYDAQQIKEGMQYSVRATIRHAGQLLFTSDTHYPVLTRGAGNTADLLLIRVN